MTTASPHGRAAFVPWTPPRPERPLGWLGQLRALANNPIESWTRAHFELPVVAGPSLAGYLVLVNDPAGIRHVLVDHADNYEKDPLQLRVLAAGSRSGAGEGLLVARGETWRRTRRTLAPLFTPRRTAGWARTMQDRAERRVSRWLKRRPGAILEIDREMTGVTCDILSATLFSDALAQDAGDIETQLADLLDAIGRIHPLDVLNAPSWAPRIGRGRARAARAFFDQAIARLIADRAEIIAAGGDAPDDLLTALLRASDPETGAGLTQGEVAANLFTFIAAGHETTARALAWTFYLLSRAPYWEERCAAEAAAASVDPADWLESMPALRAALEEAMRLFPPVPHMSRIAGRDDVIAGVKTPAGSLVVIAPWVLHRHKLLWDAPDAFDPSRFLPGARETIDRFAYLPFGAGPRVCIGQLFAMQEAMIVLATALRRVRLRHRGPEPRPLHRITLRPASRLTMAVEARTIAAQTGGS